MTSGFCIMIMVLSEIGYLKKKSLGGTMKSYSFILNIPNFQCHQNTQVIGDRDLELRKQFWATDADWECLAFR